MDISLETKTIKAISEKIQQHLQDSDIVKCELSVNDSGTIAHLYSYKTERSKSFWEKPFGKWMLERFDIILIVVIVGAAFWLVRIHSSHLSSIDSPSPERLVVGESTERIVAKRHCNGRQVVDEQIVSRHATNTVQHLVLP